MCSIFMWSLLLRSCWRSSAASCALHNLHCSSGGSWYIDADCLWLVARPAVQLMHEVAAPYLTASVQSLALSAMLLWWWLATARAVPAATAAAAHRPTRAHPQVVMTMTSGPCLYCPARQVCEFCTAVLLILSGTQICGLLRADM